jgi:hypothetical protein
MFSKTYLIPALVKMSGQLNLVLIGNSSSQPAYLFSESVTASNTEGLDLVIQDGARSVELEGSLYLVDYKRTETVLIVEVTGMSRAIDSLQLGHASGSTSQVLEGPMSRKLVHPLFMACLPVYFPYFA